MTKENFQSFNETYFHDTSMIVQIKPWLLIHISNLLKLTSGFGEISRGLGATFGLRLAVGGAAIWAAGGGELPPVLPWGLTPLE